LSLVTKDAGGGSERTCVSSIAACGLLIVAPSILAPYVFYAQNLVSDPDSAPIVAMDVSRQNWAVVVINHTSKQQ